MTPTKRRPTAETRAWVNAELQTAASLCAQATEHARVAADLCKTAAELREQAIAARRAFRIDERERIAAERERIADRRDERADWRDRTAALCAQTLEELQRSMQDAVTTDFTAAITEEINRLSARLQRERLVGRDNVDTEEPAADT